MLYAAHQNHPALPDSTAWLVAVAKPHMGLHQGQWLNPGVIKLTLVNTHTVVKGRTNCNAGKQ